MRRSNSAKSTGHRAKPARKPKFQADLAPFEDSAVRSLMALAIEIVSDSNTAVQLDLKTDLYFANGANEV